MKERLQGVIAGLLIGVFCCGSIAFAKKGSEHIEAMYSNIKIYVDGIKVEPKDANGSTVEPFIYNGTTYLPVRAVGEAIGKQVSWDGGTQTIYIGEKPGDTLYFTDLCPAYESDYYRYKECTSNNGEYFLMAGKSYTNGFTVDPYNGVTVTSLYNLNGKYNNMKFIVGHVDGTAMETVEVKFYADGKIVKNLSLTPDSLPTSYEINLNGALQLKIEAVQPEHSWSSYATYGFADVVIK